MAKLLSKFTRLLLLVFVSDVVDLLVSFRQQLSRWWCWSPPTRLIWRHAEELVSDTNPEAPHDLTLHNQSNRHHYYQHHHHFLLPAVEARGVAGLGKAGGEGGGGADKAGQQVPSEVYVALTYAGTAFLLTLSVPLILYGLNKVLNRIEDCFGCGSSSRRRRRELRKEKARVEEEEDGDADEEVVVMEADEEEKAKRKLLSSLEQQLQTQLIQQESLRQYHHHHQQLKQQPQSLTSVEASLANGNIPDTTKLSLMSQLQQQLFHLQQQQQIEQQSLAATLQPTVPTSCDQPLASLENGPANLLQQQQQTANFSPFVLSSPHL